MTHTRAGGLILLLILGCGGCGVDPDAPRLDLPPRPADAPGAAEIIQDLRALGFEAREERIFAEVARGNVPDWLRRLRPVEISDDRDGRTRRVTFWVTPDYLAIGSDTDYFLVPVSPRTAHRIAELVGASIPTSRMVDAAWAAARVRLIPIRIPPDEHVATMRYFERHNQLVQAQRRQHRAPPGRFVAGHKLDIVLAETPVKDPDDVAVYGWHHRNGVPIQPLYRIPVDGPPHFSMGVRLAHRHVLIDGSEADLSVILRDPDLGRVVGE